MARKRRNAISSVLDACRAHLATLRAEERTYILAEPPATVKERKAVRAKAKLRQERIEDLRWAVYRLVRVQSNTRQSAIFQDIMESTLEGCT